VGKEKKSQDDLENGPKFFKQNEKKALMKRTT